MFLRTILFVLLANISLASAHCPVSFKPENACLMLDQNDIYVYDRKGEHNGPYKDLAAGTILSISAAGKPIKFARVARGIYRLESANPLKMIEIEMNNAGKKQLVKLSKD